MVNKNDYVVLTNKIEPKGYIQYLRSNEDYQLVIFQTNVSFSYDGHNFFNIPRNSVVIYKPYSIMSYKSQDTQMLNSFMYLKVDQNYFSNFKFQLNNLFVISEDYKNQIVFLMDRLSYIVNTPFADHLVESIPKYVNEILTLLNEAYLGSTKINAEETLLSSLLHVRNSLYNDPVKHTVKYMADLLGYSETYFGIKYRELFHITPSQDRKFQIVELIKSYLEKTNYSLEKIADLCEVKSIPYLINLFKSVENITPHQYRLNLHR